jgi:hypothetical protein
MPCTVHNPSVEPLTLPYPFRGVLFGGKFITLNMAPADVMAAIGGEANLGGLKLTELPVSYGGPFDTTFVGDAGTITSVVDYIAAQVVGAGAGEAAIRAGLAALTTNPAFNSTRLTTVADPSAAQDAATKNYVDMGVAPTPFAFSNTTTLENGTSYLGPWHLEAASDATERFILVPFACKLRALYAWVSTKHNQTGETVILTVRKNGSDGALTVTFAKDDTAKFDTTVGHAMTFAAGDRLSVKCLAVTLG